MSKQLEITDLYSRKWDEKHKKHWNDNFDTSTACKLSNYYDKKKIS